VDTCRHAVHHLWTNWRSEGVGRPRRPDQATECGRNLATSNSEAVVVEPARVRRVKAGWRLRELEGSVSEDEGCDIRGWSRNTRYTGDCRPFVDCQPLSIVAS